MGGSVKHATSELDLSMFMSWLLAATLLATSIGLVASGYHLGVFVLMLGIVTAIPWLIVRAICVPLGMWRTAYAMGLLSGWTWRGHRLGGALVGAAWALLRRRKAHSAAIMWLEQQRNDAEELAGPHVLASGMLAVRRGDTTAARTLLNYLLELAENRGCPPITQKLAREWLAVDAADCGDWQRVGDLAQELPNTRMTRFLGTVSRCLTGAAVPSSEVWLSWLLAPQRRSTRHLRDAALNSGPGNVAPAVTPSNSDFADSDLHTATLRLHASLLARDPKSITQADVQQLARSWDKCLASAALRDEISHRTKVLGRCEADDAFRRFEGQVQSSVLEVVRRAELSLACLPADSGCLRGAVAQLRETLLNEIELAYNALHDRIDDDRALPAIDELRELLSLRDIYERAIIAGGEDLRRLAFPIVHESLCAFAVWLWNEREEYIVAHSLFQWLMLEAVKVGDERAIELQRENLDVWHA